MSRTRSVPINAFQFVSTQANLRKFKSLNNLKFIALAFLPECNLERFKCPIDQTDNNLPIVPLIEYCEKKIGSAQWPGRGGTKPLFLQSCGTTLKVLRTRSKKIGQTWSSGVKHTSLKTSFMCSNPTSVTIGGVICFLMGEPGMANGMTFLFPNGWFCIEQCRAIKKFNSVEG